MQLLICSGAILQSCDKVLLMNSRTTNLELSSSAVFVMVLQMVFLFVSFFKLYRLHPVVYKILDYSNYNCKHDT
jgi:hypothetical protein